MGIGLTCGNLPMAVNLRQWSSKSQFYGQMLFVAKNDVRHGGSLTPIVPDGR